MGVGLLGVVMDSWVSGASVYLLFNCLMSLQSFVVFVLKLMLSRCCFQCAVCSCRISSDISWFSVCIRSMISGVGNWHLR